MNVMNIKHYLSAMAALAMLAACSDYDPGMSENAVDLTDAEIATIEEYNANFIARYGTPAEGHTWGFGAKGSEDEMGTRYSSPNSNMWIECIKGKVTINGNEEDAVVDFNTNGRTVPGFPVKNYYLSSDYNKESEGDPTKPVRYTASNNPQNSSESTLDPIIYEGYYHCAFPNEVETVNGVTRPKEHWFKTKEEVISYMQRNNPSRTLYTEIIPLGDVAQFNTLTDAEVADVYAEFSKEWTGSNPQIDWDTYFVQQVWKGIATYTGTKQDGTKVSGIVGGDHMDYLVCDGGAVDGNHFYNFNYSDYQLGRKGMMLIVDGNTTNFGYHSSMDNSDWYNHFRLVELHGNYYVGFDFESNGSDEGKIERDNIYNDWIIKIIPGNGEKSHNWHRIMCEDLGSTDDYDFNDLVYDVYFTGTNNKYTAHIKVLASGGTLPIYIGTYNEVPGREAHQILQNGNAAKMSERLYQPVNVSAGVTADPVEITFEMKDSQGNWLTGDAGTDPDNIPILVTSSDNSRQTAANKNTFVLPTAGTSVTPQKICIDGNLVDATKVKWMKERQQIEDSYQNFDMWATGGPNSDYGFGKTNDWTKFNIKNPSKLY